MDPGLQFALETKNLCCYNGEGKATVNLIDEESQQVKSVPLEKFVSDGDALYALTMLIRVSQALADVYLDQNAELRTIRKRVREVNESLAALNFIVGEPKK